MTVMKMKEVFSDRIFNSKLAQYALPFAFQSLMLASVAAADAIMLGKLDQDSMTAVSLATQIQFVQNMILSSVIAAAMALGSQYYGKNDRKTLDSVVGIAFRLCSATSLIFFAGCFFFPEYLMLLFTNEPDLIAIGVRYLKISCWSYLITGISQCYLCTLKITEHPKDVALIGFSTVAINILLNAILIFGLFGMPEMGVRGAAAATLAARIIELIWSIGISFRKDYFSPSVRGMTTFNKLLSADFAKCVIPIVGASMLWTVGFTSYSSFMGHLGKDASAANSVAAVVRDLVCCLCNGIASGGEVLVGNELGKGDLEKGKEYGIKLGYIAFICGFSSTVLMLIATPLLISFVRLTEKATDYLILMMIVMSFYMIGRAVNTIIINGVFTAGGDTMFDVYSLAVTMWGIAVPLAALGTFIFHWNPIAVYTMTCLDEVGKIPWVVYHFKKYKWVRNLTREY